MRFGGPEASLQDQEPLNLITALSECKIKKMTISIVLMYGHRHCVRIQELRTELQ